MFEDLPRWPLMHRPGIDPEPTLAQRRAARAKWPVSPMSRQSHIEHSMYRMCGHERIERMLLAQDPQNTGMTYPLVLESHPKHTRPALARPCSYLPSKPSLEERLKQIPTLGARTWHRREPWHLPLGIERMFMALEASDVRWMLTGGLALAAWSRPRVIGGIDVFTDAPEQLFDVLNVPWKMKALDSNSGLVARIIGENQGAWIDVWDHQVGIDFEQAWHNRLRLSVERGPGVDVMGRDALIQHKLRLNRSIDYTDLLMLCETYSIIHGDNVFEGETA